MSFTRLIALLMLALPLCLRADTIIMKTGVTMEGEKIGEDDASYEIKVEHGTVRVLKEKILRIEQPTPEEIAEREEKEAEEKEIAEKMKEEGKIKYKGKWVTEDEKEADEKKVAAAKKKKETARAEAKKKAEAEAKKKKDADEKRLADLQKQEDQLARNNQLDDPRAARFAERHGGQDSNGYNNNNYNSNNSRSGRNGRSGRNNNTNDMLNNFRNGSNLLNNYQQLMGR